METKEKVFINSYFIIFAKKFKYVLVASIILFSGFFIPVVSASDAKKIILYNRVEHRKNLLTLSLDKTVKEYGPYNLVMSVKMDHERSQAELEENKIVNVILAPYNPDMETKLLPVKFCVMKGLLGYRILLIKKGDQEKFNGIKSLDDWKKRNLVVGQGKLWADTKILEFNGINVVKTSQQDQLIEMLNAGRFDAYPRGVTEIVSDYEKYKDKNVEIEKKLLIVYSMPDFWWVSKKDPELAKRIEKGYQLAMDDGSFDADFQRRIREEFHIENLSLKDRIVIRLTNPYLSENIKQMFNIKTFWYNP